MFDAMFYKAQATDFKSLGKVLWFTSCYLPKHYLLSWNMVSRHAYHYALGLVIELFESSPVLR